MKKNDKMLGFDPGYGWVKWTQADLRVHTFRSAVAPGYDQEWNAGLGSTSGHRIKFAGNDVYVGEVAQVMSKNAIGSLARNRADSFEASALLYATLADAYPDGATGIRLYSNLPVRWLRDRKRYLEAWPGSHKINVDGKMITWDIEEVQIAPQGFPAICDAGIKWDGGKISFENEKIFSGHTTVADFGTLTLNVFTFKNKVWQKEYSDSFELGMAWAIERITGTLESEFGISFSRNEVDDAIRTGFIAVQGQEFATHRFVAPTLALLGKEAARVTSSILGEAINKVDQILLAGGGAHRIGEHFRAAINHASVIEVSEPEYANARGLVKWGIALGG